MRFQPILTDTGLDDDGYSGWQRGSHGLGNLLNDRLLLGLMQIKHDFRHERLTACGFWIFRLTAAGEL